jgi:hypothetical protein
LRDEVLHFFLTGQLHSVARDENLVVQVFQIGFGHDIARAQAQELKDAYAPWIALDVSDEQEGWILMTGQKS